MCKILRRFVLVAAAAVLLPVGRCAANPNVFKRVAPSSVLILLEKGGAIGCGSGVLVDREAKVVLTAAHVVAGASTIVVVFPETKDGRVITSAKYYVDKKAGTKAEILELDERRDVALVTLSNLPDHVPAIAMADNSPMPGQAVFAVGNSSFVEGGVFGFVGGMTRHVYEHPKSGVTVINSSIATNRGDSGGPVVTEDGKLVGIVSSGTTGSGEGIQLRDYSVDVTEIRAVLKSAKVAGYGQPKPAFSLPTNLVLTPIQWETKTKVYPNGVRIIRDSYGRVTGVDFFVPKVEESEEPTQDSDKPVTPGFNFDDPFGTGVESDSFRALRELSRRN